MYEHAEVLGHMAIRIGFIT